MDGPAVGLEQCTTAFDCTSGRGFAHVVSAYARPRHQAQANYQEGDFQRSSSGCFVLMCSSSGLAFGSQHETKSWCGRNARVAASRCIATLAHIAQLESPLSASPLGPSVAALFVPFSGAVFTIFGFIRVQY